MEFSTKEACQITGVETERLKVWIGNKYISPSIERARGRGTRNIWSRIDLYNIGIFKFLLACGFSWQVADEFISQGAITEEEDQPIDEIGFIVFMRQGDEIIAKAFLHEQVNVLEVAWIKAAIDTDELGEDRQSVNLIDLFDNLFMVNFSKIRREIDEKIEACFGKE